jgi:hypothetical protein
MRRSQTLLEIIERGVNLSIADPRRYGTDQTAINKIIKTEFKAYRDSQRIKSLPRFLFPTGLVFFVRDYNQKYQIMPMMAHANYYGGTIKKRKLFKDRKMWYVGEEFAQLTSEKLHK